MYEVITIFDNIVQSNSLILSFNRIIVYVRISVVISSNNILLLLLYYNIDTIPIYKRRGHAVFHIEFNFGTPAVYVIALM